MLLVIALVQAGSARHQWRRVTVAGLLTAAFQRLFFVAVVAAGLSGLAELRRLPPGLACSPDTTSAAR